MLDRTLYAQHPVPRQHMREKEGCLLFSKNKLFIRCVTLVMETGLILTAAERFWHRNHIGIELVVFYISHLFPTKKYYRKEPTERQHDIAFLWAGGYCRLKAACRCFTFVRAQDANRCKKLTLLLDYPVGRTTAEPVSRDQILRRERGQGHFNVPCSADHEQDWQPYPVGSSLVICDDHTTHVQLRQRALLTPGVWGYLPDHPKSRTLRFLI